MCRTGAQRFGKLLVFVGREPMQRFTHEDLARLNVVAAQPLVRPHRECDGRNHEEREERKREPGVIGVDPMGGADAHPAP